MAIDVKNVRMSQFWEMKAKRYSMPDDPETRANTERTIARVKERGVAIAGGTILDIGCGTGIFTVPLASEARHVVGLDSSDLMLERMRCFLQENRIDNIRTVHASWKGFDVDARGFEGGFDVVWASMTPAVREAADILLMERCSRRWCVYIGWGRTRRNPFAEEVFCSHGAGHAPPSSTTEILEIIKDIGRIPSLEFLEESWTWEGTVEEAYEDMAGHLAMRGVKVEPNVLREIVVRNAVDGVVRHRTRAEKGVIVWRIDG